MTGMVLFVFVVCFVALPFVNFVGMTIVGFVAMDR
jgi:hypothetical protein